MVHSELMTHRDKTRNGRSSRAVPVVTLMEEARNPYVPHFMKNQPGMSASEEFSPEEFAEIETIWRNLAEHTRLEVMRMQQLNLHKQWANRPLEWFGYIDVLVSATAWSNFLALRTDASAQPEMQDVATVITELLDASKPTELREGQWHTPYIDRERDDPLILDFLRDEWTNTYGLDSNPYVGGKVEDIAGDDEQGGLHIRRKLSTARCARLSYKPFDGKADIASEVERHDRLVVSRPVHASPAEHIATPDRIVQSGTAVRDGQWVDEKAWETPMLHGNFTGWNQYRKLLPYEAVMEDFNPNTLVRRQG